MPRVYFKPQGGDLLSALPCCVLPPRLGPGRPPLHHLRSRVDVYTVTKLLYSLVTDLMSESLGHINYVKVLALARLQTLPVIPINDYFLGLNLIFSVLNWA